MERQKRWKANRHPGTYPHAMGAWVPVPLAVLNGGPVVELGRYTIEWPQLWARMRDELRRRGYQEGTLRIYRHVLRRFSRCLENHPCYARAEDARDYVYSLHRCSWSWIALNISVLRTVFDKLGGLDITRGLRTPKRPDRLPEILTPDEILRILRAAPTARDQLLLGLMYGCGLKVGEVCRLRWRDVDIESKTATVRKGGNPVASRRSVRFPGQLLPLLQRGKETCDADAYVFVGNRPGRHLTTRMANRVLRGAVRDARIERPVCGMTLRHSYAVHCLQMGATIREVQEALGHNSVETTLMYERCSLPEGVVSPADQLDVAVVDGLLAGQEPIEPVEMPFAEADPSGGPLMLDFCRSLGAHLTDRFLAIRRAIGRFPTGPPG